MTTKKYKLPIEQEKCDYLQRLGFEVDAKAMIIDRMITNHKDDPDASVFESAAWKKYSEEHKEANAAYELAKGELGKELQAIVDQKEGREGVQFDWTINDFTSGEVEITIRG